MSDCKVGEPFIGKGDSSDLVFHPITHQLSFIINANETIECSRDVSAVLVHESESVSELVARQRSPRSCVITREFNNSLTMVSSKLDVNLVPFTTLDRVISVDDHQSMYYIRELYTTTRGDFVFVRVSLAYGLCQAAPSSIKIKLGNCTSESFFYRPSCPGDFVNIIVRPSPDCEIHKNTIILPVNDDFVNVGNQVKYMSFHVTDIRVYANLSGCENVFTPTAKAVLRVQFNSTRPDRSQSSMSLVPARSFAHSRIELVPAEMNDDGIVEYTTEECLPIDRSCFFSNLYQVSLHFNETIAQQTFTRTSEIMLTQQNQTCDIPSVVSNITFTNSGVLRLFQNDPHLIVELDTYTTCPSIDSVQVTLETDQGKPMLVRSFSVHNKRALYMNPSSPYFNDIHFCRSFEPEFALCQNLTSIDRFIFNPHLWGITSGYFRVTVSVLATISSSRRQLIENPVILSTNTTMWIKIHDSSTKSESRALIPLLASITVLAVIFILRFVWKRNRGKISNISYKLIT